MHVMVAADCPEEGCHPGGLAAGRLRHRGAQRQARGRARPLPQGGQAARGPQRQGEIWVLVLLFLCTLLKYFQSNLMPFCPSYKGPILMMPECICRAT